MNETRRTLSARPWLAPLVAAAAAVALLVVPFSYQKTVAYDVSFHLAAGSPALAPGLSTALAESFGATSINSTTEPGGGLTLTARVPAGKAGGVATHASSFAAVLGSMGHQVTTDVVPVRENVSGNLFAMTRDQTVRVDITATGRTPAEIEADVRRQLEAAGLNNAEVSVSRDGEKTTIQVMAHHEGTEAPPEGEERNFEFTIDGSAPDPAKTATVRINRHGQPMSDAEIKQTIESQLAAQGHPAVVEVRDGKVLSVTPVKN